MTALLEYIDPKKRLLLAASATILLLYRLTSLM